MHSNNAMLATTKSLIILIQIKLAQEVHVSLLVMSQHSRHRGVLSWMSVPLWVDTKICRN